MWQVQESESDFNTENCSDIFAIGLQMVIKYYFCFNLTTQNVKRQIMFLFHVTDEKGLLFHLEITPIETRT